MSKKNTSKYNDKNDSSEEEKSEEEKIELPNPDDIDDSLGDDENEIDDEDKDINNDNDEGDDDENDGDKKDIDDNCLYNYADEKSDDETEFVFDDDIIPEDHNIVAQDKRRTKPILYKYERVRLLGARTRQLTLGAKPMIKNVGNMDAQSIAEEEIKQNMIPLKIRRPLPNGQQEIWLISELEH